MSGNLKYLIEYDGRHHFEPVDFGNKGSKKSLEFYNDIKRKDAIKNKYCHKNNIPLFRIPYWEYEKDNIKEILDEIINGNELYLLKKLS